MGDEHGAIIAPAGAAPPRLGEVVTLGAPHCDPTVNLYDAYHAVKGDTLIGIWPVDARGRSA
jgi:D-serine deaminase-like pyridoxal phosphate-dependent protein